LRPSVESKKEVKNRISAHHPERMKISGGVSQDQGNGMYDGTHQTESKSQTRGVVLGPGVHKTVSEITKDRSSQLF